MKAIYVKPSVKLREIDTEEIMQTGSIENNITPAGDNKSYTGSVGNTEVTPQDALSKQGSFLVTPWDDEE